MEAIYVWDYALRTKVALNSVTQRRFFEGALIRHADGFGCVHPWPEFGDAPLAEQMALLTEGTLTPVTQRALHCAQIDGEARRAGLSLFAGLEIPQSHWSWSFSHSTNDQIARVLGEGWPAIKAKGLPNHGETARFLEACCAVAGNAPLRLRVDFNGCLDAASFGRFVEFMPLKVYRRLDFVEDPFPYDPALWNQVRDQWGVRLALDKGWRDGTTGFDAVVVKPGRRDWRNVAEVHPTQPLVLTSAMDHAIGQMYAAYEAAVALQELGSRVDLCGLCTHHLFEPDCFFDRIEAHAGFLSPDLSGGGLGFGDLLEGLPWRRLR